MEKMPFQRNVLEWQKRSSGGGQTVENGIQPCHLGMMKTDEKVGTDCCLDNT
jgi:hypothetical protein